MPVSIFDPTAVLGLDFYGFLLPWIFTFAIVFGLLSKLTIFEKSKQVNVALSFVIAFFATAVGGPQLAAFFTSLFGGAAAYLAGILVIILFLAMIGKGDQLGKSYAYVIVLIIIGVLLFLTSSSYFGVAYLSPYAASVIFWLIIIIIAVYLITRGDGKAAETPTGGGRPER